MHCYSRPRDILFNFDPRTQQSRVSEPNPFGFRARKRNESGQLVCHHPCTNSEESAWSFAANTPARVCLGTKSTLRKHPPLARISNKGWRNAGGRHATPQTNTITESLRSQRIRHEAEPPHSSGGASKYNTLAATMQDEDCQTQSGPDRQTTHVASFE